MHLKKILIGIKPAQRMFRVSSVMGLAVDEILSLRGTGDFDEQYYSEVSRNFEQGFTQLKGDGGRNICRIDQEGIVFSRASYLKDGADLHGDKVIGEFLQIWKRANDFLKLKDIRRIGIVGEYRISYPGGQLNTQLMSRLSTLPAPINVTKFHTHFERSEHIKSKHGIPNPTNDDMFNVIVDIYDSTMDNDFPAADAVNVNFDVQRYFMPHFNGGIQAEVQKLKRMLDEERQKLVPSLRDKGIVL